MASTQVIYITRGGTQVAWLESITELRGYSLLKIEPDPYHNSGGKTIVLSKSSGEVYRVYNRVWRELTIMHKGKNIPLEQDLQSLIDAVDTELEKLSEEEIRLRDSKEMGLKRELRGKNVRII